MISWKKFWIPLKSLVKGMIPTPYLILLMCVGCFLIALASIWNVGWFVFLAYNGMLMLFVLIDYLSFKRLPSVKAKRVFQSLFELTEKNQVKIHIHVEHPLYTKMWVQDDYPQGFWVDQRTFQLKWSGETKQSITYWTRPHRRGRHVFQQIHLRMRSKWRLFLFQIDIPHLQEVRVYPSLEPTRKVRKGVYETANDGDTFVTKSLATGRDFSHLREYVSDDEARNINWMATARAGKLVSNVFQPESGQRVTILLDCGRLMGVQDEGRSRLDISLEAVLGFAAIALQRGDHVSFIAFTNQVIRFVPPGKGMRHLQKIIEASYDLDASYIETDYLCVWERLEKTHKQKNLIALFTDMANLSFSETIDQMIRLTQNKHLVLTVSLQDSRLIERLYQIPKNDREVYEQMVMENLMEERRATLRKWGTRQFTPLDVRPDQMASAVIYKYLEIRKSQELKGLRI